MARALLLRDSATAAWFYTCISPATNLFLAWLDAISTTTFASVLTTERIFRFSAVLVAGALHVPCEICQALAKICQHHPVLQNHSIVVITLK
jgi:hypothetical protein